MDTAQNHHAQQCKAWRNYSHPEVLHHTFKTLSNLHKLLPSHLMEMLCPYKSDQDSRKGMEVRVCRGGGSPFSEDTLPLLSGQAASSSAGRLCVDSPGFVTRGHGKRKAGGGKGGRENKDLLLKTQGFLPHFK